MAAGTWELIRSLYPEAVEMRADVAVGGLWEDGCGGAFEFDLT